ncbi:MAG: alkaline phosphatase family protein [Chitinophagales bacterium]|nr:alkaline phosphatase family protein [Chitinophagales bacterium]
MLNKYFFFLTLSLLLFSCKEKEVLKDNCLDNGASQNQSFENRKVLIIGIDGFRSDCMNDSISPFLYSLSQDPKCFYNSAHQVENVTVSGPNWTSILSGVHYEKHLASNTFSEYKVEEFPHFYKYIEEANSNLNTVSICNWAAVNVFIAYTYGDYCPLVSYDDLTVNNWANDIILGNDSVEADLLFLHFDNLDHEGHAFGYSPEIPEYAQAVNTMDGYVASLMASINQKRNEGEDWLVLVVSDHGGEGTDHANGLGNSNIDRTICFVDHPSLNFKSNYPSKQVDYVPTIFQFLGIESAAFSCQQDGVSLLE